MRFSHGLHNCRNQENQQCEDDKIIAVYFFLFHFSVYVSKIPKGDQIFIFRDFAYFYI